MVLHIQLSIGFPDMQKYSVRKINGKRKNKINNIDFETHASLKEHTCRMENPQHILYSIKRKKIKLTSVPQPSPSPSNLKFGLCFYHHGGLELTLTQYTVHTIINNNDGQILAFHLNIQQPCSKCTP